MPIISTENDRLAELVWFDLKKRSAEYEAALGEVLISLVRHVYSGEETIKYTSMKEVISSGFYDFIVDGAHGSLVIRFFRNEGVLTPGRYVIATMIDDEKNRALLYRENLLTLVDDQTHQRLISHLQEKREKGQLKGAYRPAVKSMKYLNNNMITW